MSHIIYFDGTLQVIKIWPSESLLCLSALIVKMKVMYSAKEHEVRTINIASDENDVELTLHTEGNSIRYLGVICHARVLLAQRCKFPCAI
jgi:hypothetical protein